LATEGSPKTASFSCPGLMLTPAISCSTRASTDRSHGASEDGPRGKSWRDPRGEPRESPEVLFGSPNGDPKGSWECVPREGQ